MFGLFGGKPQQPSQPQYTFIQPSPPTQNYSHPPIPIETLQKKNQNKCRELSELITNLEREAAELFRKTKQSKGSSKQMYKNRCTQVLKKKKLYEQQLKTYMGQNNMLDQVNFTKQNIQNTIEMGHVMKQTVEAQKAMMQHVNIDHLEDIRDQMQQMKFESDYTNQLLNRDYNIQTDDIDLDAQMQDLDADFFREVMQNAPKKAINIPNQQQQQYNYGGLQKDSIKF